MRKSILQAAALAVVASAAGIAIAVSIHWFPSLASKQATEVHDLYDVLLIVSVPIFVLVLTVVGFSIWKFRMRPGQENQDGPPIHGDTRLEIVWTALPAIMLISLAAYTYVVLQRIEKKGPREVQVKVSAQQFAWQFHYPAATTGGKPITANQLYLPIGRSVNFTVASQDVIHDFWVPNFSIKIDAVPGINTTYRITPSHLGNYPVVCAELCGLGHSTMRSTVHVVTEQKYKAWMAAQLARPSVAPPANAGGA